MKPEVILAARFHALFAGREDVHGAYNNISLDKTRNDGKQKGTAITLRDLVTDELWQKHLDGQSGIGVVPIRDDGTCVFGAIDVDSYTGLDLGRVAATLIKHGLALIICRSKSGGLHLYLFSKEPIAASKMQERLRGIAALLGFGGCEIFPKQSKNDSEFGSWINMPYFDCTSTLRYAIKANGDAMSPEEFLDAAEAAKQPAVWFAAPLPQQGQHTDVLPDGPPCLQHLMELGFPPGTWNSGVFNLGIYCRKAHPDNWKDRLVQLNAVNFPPDKWPSTDLEAIVKSLSKGKDYFYQCNKAPLVQHCNRELCQQRKFGIGTSSKSLVEALADAILERDNFARDKGDRLYHFQDGCYRPTGERFIKMRVKALALEWDRSRDWTPQLAERVQEWITTDRPELWETPPLDTVNCANGLLDVATRTLRPHSAEFLSAVQIPVLHDPQALCPHIDRFIVSTFPEDAQHLPFEICSWLMTPDVSIQKAVLLLGEGANGKSVFLTLLLNFLGMENVSTLSLHRIEGDKFSAARLVGKLANFGMDLPSKELTGTSVFKALCGGDVIVGERKFESSFEFRPFARLIFSANTAPRSDDSSHGFFRRWLTIQFEKTFNETDPNTVPRATLDAQLSEPRELSGLLNRALDKLPVIRRGAFTECESTRKALQQFRETTDPLSVWLDGNTLDKVESFVTKDTVRRAYSQVCQEQGRPIMNDVQFTSALRRLKPKVELSRRMVDGRRVQVFVGLGMVAGDQEPSGMF